MLSSLGALIIIFVAAAAAVWVAGIHLSTTTDVLSERLHLGAAIGNILGGIAIQTVVLVVLDFFGLGGRNALSYVGSSLQLVLEGGLVIAVLVVAVMGTQLPGSATHFRLEPAAILITALWVVGLA